MADIDPINAPLAGKGVSLLGAFGARWRKGLGRFEDVNESARLRWAANESYRPRPLAGFAARIVETVRAAA
jgi:hypothetical protein